MKSILGRLRSRRLVSTFTILATLSAGILIGSVVAHGVHGQESQQASKIDTSDATPLKVPAPRDLSTDFTRIAKQVGPAVVNISTVQLPKHEQNRRRGFSVSPFGQQGPDNGGGGDEEQGPNNFQDFFQHFFGMPGQGPDESGQERQSLGSGMIVDARGYIITNDHVIKGADKIWVRLSTDPNNGFMQGRPAKVVGIDKATDIAVLKIKADPGHPFPTVKMGNSDGAQVGDWVIAIGSPFTLSQTVTAGIVSAKNRTINPGVGGQYQHFIQTDAAINPGNSGGPLLNMAGEVIGMNTAIYTESGTYAGIGFAMPANTIISVYNDLIGPEHKVVRGSIGITFQPNLPTAVAKVYGFKNGVLVSSVQPGFPADKAGLKAGDVITSVNGKPVKDGDELVNIISAKKPGTTIQLGYIRNGQSHTASVTVSDREKMMEAINKGQGGQNNPNENGNGRNEQAKLGITVSNLPEGAPAGLHGVLIQSVKPGSFADEIGLQEGGVIVSVNKHPVNNVNDFRAIIAGLQSGSDVAFEVVNPQAPNGGSFYRGGTLP